MLNNHGNNLFKLFVSSKTVILFFSVIFLSACQGKVVKPDEPDKEEKVITSIERSSVKDKADEDENKFNTKEQRLKVKPLDWDKTRGKPDQQAIERLKKPVEKQPVSSEPGKPSPEADREAQKAFPDQWQRDEETGNQDPTQKLNFVPGNDGLNSSKKLGFYKVGTKDVYTQFQEPQNTPYPQRTIGKLFTNAGSCSASVVSGNNAIVTAAHCCYDRGKGNWIGGWTFAPAYDQGNTPYGQFGWVSATILTSWITAGNRASDVCVIKLGNNNANRPVTFYTGWLGRSWNYPTIQDHFAFGYPGNLGGGQTLQLCTSESFNPSSSCGGNGVLNTGCTMTYGSSGGPWIRHYMSGNWVNSVVSGYDDTTCTGTFGETFNGPRFTTGNIKTICDAAGC